MRRSSPARPLAASCIVAGLLALPAAGQDAAAPDEPASVIAEVEAGENQAYVLERCAGFYKALLTVAGGPEAGTETTDRAADSLRFLTGIIVGRALAAAGAAEDDAGAVDETVAQVTPGIDAQRDFYLRYLVDRQEAGLAPMGPMLVSDSEACRMLQAQRDAR